MMSFLPLLTASLTTEIINIHSPPKPQMTGRIVGALQRRLHDVTMIAQNGGILHEISDDNTILGVFELIKKLQRKSLDGFLINKSTYYYFSRKVHNAKYKDIVSTIGHLHMIRTELFFQKGILTYGMLVKDHGDYKYFKQYFETNWLQIQAYDSLILNVKDGNDEYNFRSKETDLFDPYLSFLYYALGILGVIICFGGFYELRRKWKHPV